MTKEYIRRINLALNYIDENLDQDLNLAILAKIAHYSPFHFHRLFTGITGENPNKYILRLRIERAAYQIKKQSSLSISEIAFRNGFVSNSNFSKAFKKYYGISPSFLRKNTDEFSKIRQIKSKNGQVQIEITDDFRMMDHLNLIQSTTPITIRKIPDVKVAYVNYVGAFDKIGHAYDILMKWAKGVNLGPVKSITRFHDSPEVTEICQVRQSACVELKGEYPPSDDISFSTIVGGKHAVGSFELVMSELDSAWQSMMLWVAEHELIIDERKTSFEVYHRTSKEVPFKMQIEIFVPIKSKD